MLNVFIDNLYDKIDYKLCVKFDNLNNNLINKFDESIKKWYWKYGNFYMDSRLVCNKKNGVYYFKYKWEVSENDRTFGELANGVINVLRDVEEKEGKIFKETIEKLEKKEKVKII